MWYMIAGIGLEKVVESPCKVLKFSLYQTVATVPGAKLPVSLWKRVC